MEQELLKAIHEVDKKVEKLETKIDESVQGRFKDHDRRISQLETNQRWVVISILSMVILAVLNLVIR